MVGSCYLHHRGCHHDSAAQHSYKTTKIVKLGDYLTSDGRGVNVNAYIIRLATPTMWSRATPLREDIS